MRPQTHNECHHKNAGGKTQNKSVEFIEPILTKHKCEYLWDKIKAFQDKLFIVVEQETSQLLAPWYAVQVYIDETNKREGF